MKKNSFWNKRIPTLFGLFLIVVGIGLTSYLANNGTISFLHASPTEDPQDIRITNITDSSLSVTYSTVESVTGAVTVSKDTTVTSGQVFLDDRDQSSGVPAPHFVHSITLRNLQPKTTYYFAINSGKTTYLNNNQPFSVTTGDTISEDPSDEDPLAGILTLPSGNKPSEALVYVTTDGGQTLSTLMKPSGIYIIPLNTIRSDNFGNYLALTQATIFQILVVGPEGKSQATVSATQRNPVPSITLSNNYDFTVDTNPIATSSASPTGFPVFALDTTIQLTPQIDTPKDNQTFTDSQPLLQGKALPGETVDITIHSDQAVNAQVTADQNGNWTYRPTQPLSPGQHTITITTKDKFGILKTIQQTFTIFEPGSQVAEAATPSGKLSPTPKVTPKPTLQPTPTPAITETEETTPVPTPTAVQTTKGGLTPIPQKPLPATGSGAAEAAGFVGIATTLVGVLLFFAGSGAGL